MQMLKTVKHEDLLLMPEDLANTIPVVESLPDASDELYNQYRILSKACTTTVHDPTLPDYDEVLFPGKIYKCARSYVVDHEGIKQAMYRWTAVSYTETGKLHACTNDSIVITENGSDVGGYSANLHWDDPDSVVDKTNPANSAVWKYTVVVRKKGTTAPETINDGEVVGYSAVKNQYTAGTPGFIDLIPDAAYKYNIFAVTRYDVATGLKDSGGTELDWDTLREHIINGTAASILPVGTCITVDHQQFGPLDLEVVGLDNAIITDKNGNTIKPGNPLQRVTVRGEETYHSVTLVARRCLMRAVYDVPEKHEEAGVQNPADPVTLEADKSRHWASYSGRASWVFSNLRSWLNDTGKFVLSTDPEYDTKKFYFEKKALIGGGYEYVQVVDPIIPGEVSPVLLGYYEASWNPTATTNWDKLPDPFRTEDPDAGYVYVNKQMPGFLLGFRNYDESHRGFLDLVAYSKVVTNTDPYSYQHGGTTPTRWVNTADRVFIPSYYELYGSNPEGISAKFAAEGSWWPFYNPSVPVEGYEGEGGMTYRSRIKRDITGELCGYWLRSVSTAKAASGSGWYQNSPAWVWAILAKTSGSAPVDITDTATTLTRKCAMTADEAATAKSDVPAVCWCVVLSYLAPEA